jgi:predicted nuclease of predicted toxin-antitoxin system
MRLLADMHISPATVQHLIQLGHDVVRVSAVMANNAADREIVDWAVAHDRAVLTQDLDFSDIIALSGAQRPSLITLRLSDSRVRNVNRVLTTVLVQLESEINSGIVATVEDNRVRIRRLPIQ